MPGDTHKLAESATRSEKLLRGKSPAVVIGAVMIIMGLLLFVGQLFGWSLSGLLWPLWIIVPGAAVLLFGLTAKGDAGEPLCIVGSIITTVGLVLVAQNLTGLWASWAYAWALVGPTASGVGVWLHGVLKNHPDKTKEGGELIRVGLTLFVVAFVFFELVLGISGFGLGRMALPVALIVLGLFFLARTLLGGRTEEK